MALILGPLTGIGLGKLDLTIVYLFGACLDLANMVLTWKYYPDTTAISTYRRLHTESDAEEDDIDTLEDESRTDMSDGDHISRNEYSSRADSLLTSESSRRRRHDSVGDVEPPSREFPGCWELFRTSNPLSVMRILLDTPFLIWMSCGTCFYVDVWCTVLSRASS